MVRQGVMYFVWKAIALSVSGRQPSAYVSFEFKNPARILRHLQFWDTPKSGPKHPKCSFPLFQPPHANFGDVEP